MELQGSPLGRPSTALHAVQHQRMSGVQPEVRVLAPRFKARSLKRALVTVAAVAGALLQVSSVSEVHATCLRFGAEELPRMGLIRGAWLDDTRFVLADFQRSRLLVYSTDEGFQRSILGLATSGASSFTEPIEVARWADGLLVADSTFRKQSLVALDRNLRPSKVLASSEPVGGPGEESAPEMHWRVGTIQEMAALADSLYVLGSRGREGMIVKMTKEPSAASDGPRLSVREEWELSREEEVLAQLPVHQLAVTSGETSAAFALRFDGGGFIQRLGGGATRRLSAFAATRTLPSQPANFGQRSHEAFYSMVEASGYFAGLYAEADMLYVLTKSVTEGGRLWELHQIDPDADVMVGSVRLPTTAVHVSLLPGPVHWVLEESSSTAVDLFRKPTRLLLLDSAAIRKREPITCD